MELDADHVGSKTLRGATDMIVLTTTEDYTAEDMTITEIFDVSDQRKVERMMTVLPRRAIRVLYKALQKCNSNFDDAIDMVFRQEENDDKTRGDDDLEQDGKPFQAMVHRDLLCLFSPYYQAALKGEFSEAGKKTLDVELDFMAGRMLVGWLYSGRFTCVGGWESLFSLYVFADKTDMLALRRAIMTVILDVTKRPKRMPSFLQVSLALESLPSTSPLYRWILARYVHHWMPKYETPDTELPNEFLMEWLKAAAVRTCEVQLGSCSDCPCCRLDACDFHEHESIEEWKSSKDFVVKQPNVASLKNKTGHKTSSKTDKKK
ncbi:hypothetical protein E4T48_05055 [Aureobasidium sp. EXF-10727]|nr:hypothetical protein E4T48_05055 [Aureobasidium sp. EXF-10727]